jgi:hypothetical protein
MRRVLTVLALAVATAGTLFARYELFGAVADYDRAGVLMGQAKTDPSQLQTTLASAQAEQQLGVIVGFASIGLAVFTLLSGVAYPFRQLPWRQPSDLPNARSASVELTKNAA